MQEQDLKSVFGSNGPGLEVPTIKETSTTGRTHLDARFNLSSTLTVNPHE